MQVTIDCTRIIITSVDSYHMKSYGAALVVYYLKKTSSYIKILAKHSSAKQASGKQTYKD